MDGGPSPSPSGSSRCLSELLDLQQEPFSLDLYLLEKGCSPAFLDAAVPGGGACSTCWPWPRFRCVAGRTPVRSPAASKNGSCASGMLRLLLCNILRGKVAPPTAKRRQLQPPATDQHHFDGEKRRTPGAAVNAEERVDDDESKRLSPDSVMEEQSPAAHEQKALLIFRELLQAAYAPTMLDLLAGDDSKVSTAKTSMAAKARNGRARREEDGAFEEALAEATGVVSSDMAAATRAWPGDVRLQRRGVGADIAAAVLCALVEEAVAELVDG